MRKRGMKHSITKPLHKWVARDYRPHSNFVVLKPEFVPEVSALLILMGGYVKRTKFVSAITSKDHAGPVFIASHKGRNNVLYADQHGDWILSGIPTNVLEKLGI